MRFILIPFDDKMNAVDSETLEIASSTKEEIKNHLKTVMKGKLYQIEIYKNLEDSLFIQLDSDDLGTIVFLNYNKSEYTEEITDNGYETVMTIISDYLEEDGGKRISSYFIERKEERKRIEKEKFEKWKKTYDPKTDRIDKIHYKKLALLVAGIFLLGYTIYLMWSGEIRFIGKDTEHTKAVITKIKLVPVRGGYHQRVTYKFTINGNVFKNYFTADKFTGMQYVGDSIPIKFVVNDPTISKFLQDK